MVEFQAQLESKLSSLYKALIKVSEYLTNRDGIPSEMIKAGHMIEACQDREETVILKASALTRECASQLLSLSLLVPAAPWVS